MKKEYKTPYLIMESFQLNAAVATSCSGRGTQPLGHGVDTCDLVDETGDFEFGKACKYDIINEAGGDGNDTYCYHGPIDPNTEFLAS